MSLKKTPLYQKHIDLGAKMCCFAGWEMPIQYTKLIEEHTCVRAQVGLFDVSHMGNIFVEGSQALDFLNHLVPQNLRGYPLGKAIYTQFCDTQGGIIDDLIIYLLSEDKLMLVVNASNIEKDYQWMVSHILDQDVSVVNNSDQYSIIALQGPKALDIVMQLDLAHIPNHFCVDMLPLTVAGGYIARTGYTGEDGFEFIVDNVFAQNLWDDLLYIGKDYGIMPIGLGARDTLRLEACYPLYGHDLNTAITPIEAGLGWSVTKDDKQYIGREVLNHQRKVGVDKKFVCFKMEGRNIPRDQNEIYVQGEKAGFVTSGTYSPTLQVPIGVGYIETKFQCSYGQVIEVNIRGKYCPAEIVKRPFYKRGT